MGRVPASHSSSLPSDLVSMASPTLSPSRAAAGPAVQKRARNTRQSSGIIKPIRGFQASNASNGSDELQRLIEAAVSTHNQQLEALNAQMEAMNLKGIHNKFDDLNRKVETLHNENEELLAQLKGTQEQLTKSHAKIGELETHIKTLDTDIKTIGTNVNDGRTVLSSFKQSSPSTLADPNTAASPPTSYASAASGSINPSSSATQPRLSGGAPSTPPTTPGGLRQPPGTTIDLSRLPADQLETLKDGEATEKRIRDAIAAHPPVHSIVIKGIQIKSRSIRVVTQNDKDAAQLRLNDKWIPEAFDKARTRGEEWFPIKVDDVRRESVLVPGTRKIQADFADSFSASNGFEGVMKAFWISKGEKYTGSMVVHLASAEDAKRALEERFVKVKGSLALVSEYRKLQRPQRCYNCNKYGHHKSRCDLPPKCGKCSANHETNACEATEPKCAACNGPHTAMDAGCPTYRKEVNKLRGTAHSTQQPNQGGEDEWQTVTSQRNRREVTMSDA